LAGLEARGVVGIGFGLVNLRSVGRDLPVRRFQHVGQSLAQPVGPDVREWFDRQDVLAAHPGAEVLTVPLTVADDVRIDQRWRPGEAGPLETAVLRETGFRFAGSLDAFGATLLDDLAERGADVPVGVLVVARAQAEGLDVESVLADSVPVLRRLVEEGFLVP